MCKTNSYPVSRVYKTLSREVNQHGQSICAIHRSLYFVINDVGVTVLLQNYATENGYDSYFGSKVILCKCVLVYY